MISCAEKADGSVLDSLRRMGQAAGSRWLLLWCTDFTFDRELCASNGSSGSGTPINDNLAGELRAIQALLVTIGYEEHTLPEYPGFFFTLHHKDRPSPGLTSYVIQWNDWPDGLVLAVWRPVREPPDRSSE